MSPVVTFVVEEMYTQNTETLWNGRSDDTFSCSSCLHRHHAHHHVER